MPSYKLFFTLLAFSILCACQQNTPATEEVMEKVTKEVITQYYSIRMEGDSAVRDSLKDCFSCNQGVLYDKNGRETEMRFYKGNSQGVYGMERYIYENGNQKTGSEYLENDTVTTVYKYEYDDQNRLLYSRAYDVKSNKMLYGSQYEYDDRGNQFRTGNMNGQGKVQEYYRRTYNENGIALQENIEDLEGNPTFRIKYEYRPQADSNWVEQLTYYDGVLSEIRFRKWLYWE